MCGALSGVSQVWENQPEIDRLTALETIAERVKKLRSEKGLTQQELCARAGRLAISQVQKVEQGATKWPRLDTLDRIARGLGIELWELLAPDEVIVDYKIAHAVGPRARGAARAVLLKSSPEKEGRLKRLYLDTAIRLAVNKGVEEGRKVLDEQLRGLSVISSEEIEIYFEEFNSFIGAYSETPSSSQGSSSRSADRRELRRILELSMTDPDKGRAELTRFAGSLPEDRRAALEREFSGLLETLAPASVPAAPKKKKRAGGGRARAG